MSDDAPPKRDGTSTPDKPAESSSKDVVLLGPPTADGAGVHVLRAREERVEAGELRALQEGKPVVGEIVSLKPRPENPRICDVEQSYAPGVGKKKGPAQVANDRYRDNWDEIFGKSKAASPKRTDLN
jgi:hypothetical protein